ncbi:MAG: FIST signal transduction protein, partial [Actinomycetota bacterium]
ADLLLRELDRRQPGVTVIGGMASGGVETGESRLFLGDRVVSSGGVGARLPAAVEVRSLVSQGCRPVGSSYMVTKAQGNVIAELAGRPPLERIREVYVSLSAEEQSLMTEGLHIGRVIDEYRADFGPGDFLVRGVIGADQETGAIAVGDVVGVGETIQFHVRDAASADEELRKMLLAVGNRPPAGALLFTCNGRGTRLFPVPHHDASLVSREFGDPPLAGFFCAGELGPVGGRNFLHGFTASLALFYEERRPA